MATGTNIMLMLIIVMRADIDADCNWTVRKLVTVRQPGQLKIIMR